MFDTALLSYPISHNGPILISKTFHIHRQCLRLLSSVTKTVCLCQVAGDKATD